MTFQHHESNPIANTKYFNITEQIPEWKGYSHDKEAEPVNVPEIFSPGRYFQPKPKKEVWNWFLCA